MNHVVLPVAGVGAIAVVVALAQGAIDRGGVRTGPDTSGARGTTSFSEPTEFPDTCRSGQSSHGVFDVIPPGSAKEAEAADWPRSPRDAADSFMAAGVAFPVERFGVVSMVERPQEHRGAAERGTVYEFIDADGVVVGTLTVRDMGYGTFAVTSVDQCVP